MVTQCSVRGCKNESGGGGLSFHAFPKGPDLYKIWAAACGRDILPHKPVICSAHFRKEDYVANLLCSKLKPGAIPVYLLPNSTFRAPWTELVVPSVCFSIGPEHYLEIPSLVSEVPGPIIVKTDSITSLQQLEDENNEGDSLSVDLTLSVDRNQDSKQLVMTIDPTAASQENPPEHNYALKPVSENTYMRHDEQPPSEPEYPELIEPPSSIIDNNLIERYKITKLEEQSVKQKTKIAELQRHVRILRQRLKRTKVRQERNKAVLQAVRSYTRHSEVDNILNGRFDELSKIFNENNPKVLDYSTEVVQFAISLYYLSPKAYDLVSKYMALPHFKILKKYLSKATYIINMDA